MWKRHCAQRLRYNQATDWHQHCHCVFRRRAQVFPATMQNQPLKLSASGHDLGGDILFRSRLGFSGTPSDLLPLELGRCHYLPTPTLTITFNPKRQLIDGASCISTLTLPEPQRWKSGGRTPTLTLELDRCHYEKGSDGKMLALLTSPEVVSIRAVPPKWTPRALLRAVARAHPPYHALIDAGALITGISNQRVAEILLDEGLAAHGFEGVAFLTDEGDELILKVLDLQPSLSLTLTLGLGLASPNTDGT